MTKFIFIHLKVLLWSIKVYVKYGKACKSRRSHVEDKLASSSTLAAVQRDFALEKWNSLPHPHPWLLHHPPPPPDTGYWAARPYTTSPAHFSQTLVGRSDCRRLLNFWLGRLLDLLAIFSRSRRMRQQWETWYAVRPVWHLWLQPPAGDQLAGADQLSRSHPTPGHIIIPHTNSSPQENHLLIMWL